MYFFNSLSVFNSAEFCLPWQDASWEQVHSLLHFISSYVSTRGFSAN